MPKPKLTPMDLAWLQEQFRHPQAAYGTGEWAKMAGVDTQRLVRWFLKRKLIRRGDGRHHQVTRDEVQAAWPAFWRTLRKRLGELVARAVPADEDAAA